MSRTALPRAQQAADEAGLRFVEAFLATAPAALAGDPERDELAGLTRARRWLRGALAGFAPRSRLARPSVGLRREDLAPLATFRESLREALRADAPRRSAPAGPDDFAVELRWSPGEGVRYRPTGEGWRAVAGLVAVELLRAEAAGTLGRLKTCAYPPCGFPFVDRSPTVSRMWHDTKRCGNLVNLRAARARASAGT
ncbi:CGNR zinc finger domain-containing protein [Micromonospora sp. NPDC049559]|uniref:CGNR zinc finger domain-containing protein n=1 Tax=Micromonospora sp. NPDC049559 TaxID=3155923 RepID=UPI0034378D24